MDYTITSPEPLPGVAPMAATFHQGIWSGPVLIPIAASQVALRIRFSAGLVNYAAPIDILPSQRPPHILSIHFQNGHPQIQFDAVPATAYAVLAKNDLQDATWSTVTNVPAQTDAVRVTVTDAEAATSSRFYMLVTPQVP
jgi:hypothetical protein